jgi:hypothetical protein
LGGDPDTEMTDAMQDKKLLAMQLNGPLFAASSICLGKSRKRMIGQHYISSPQAVTLYKGYPSISM